MIQGTLTLLQRAHAGHTQGRRDNDYSAALHTHVSPHRWKKRNVELSPLLAHSGNMSVAEIKEEIKNLEAPQLDELAALILQIRRAKDPERTDQVSELIDSDDWIPWKKEA